MGVQCSTVEEEEEGGLLLCVPTHPTQVENCHREKPNFLEWVCLGGHKSVSEEKGAAFLLSFFFFYSRKQSLPASASLLLIPIPIQCMYCTMYCIQYTAQHGGEGGVMRLFKTAPVRSFGTVQCTYNSTVHGTACLAGMVDTISTVQHAESAHSQSE